MRMEMKLSKISLLLLFAAFLAAVDADETCGADAGSATGGADGDGASCSSGVQQQEEVAEKKEEEDGERKRKLRWSDDVPKVLSYEFTGKEESHEEKERWEKLNYSKMPWTDKQDWEIRGMLDEAEDFIISDPDRAIRMIQKILKEHAKSARARYDLLRANEVKSVKDLSNEEKQKHHNIILDGYVALIDDHENLLYPIYNSAVHQSVHYAALHNLTQRKVDILEKGLALEGTRHNERLHNVLIIDYFMLQNYEKMLRTAETASELFASNSLFKLLNGIALKRLDRKKEGNRLLRAIETDPNDVYNHGFDILELGNELSRRGRRDDATLLYQESSKAHLFLSSHQRPLEGLEDLESKPIWNLSDDVGLTAHDEDVQGIRARLEDLQEEARSLDEPDWNPVVTGYLTSGNWSEAPLYTFRARRHHTCGLLPTTCGLLDGFRAASSCHRCTSKLVRLAPGTHLLPHCGPTNSRLRLHLPLRAPPSGCARMRVGPKEEVRWREGEWVAFDDSYEHETWNECDDDVVLLSVDVPHPDYSETTKFNAMARTIFAQL